jgi:hypothetical protein
MRYELRNLQGTDPTRKIATRCPHCGHNGTFENVINLDLFETLSRKILGLRRCPNSRCYGHFFFVMDFDSGELLTTYPSDLIPFDKESIPAKVLNSFEEAVKCHSTQCFIAAAIMIRKTLEEICLDRGATGKTLYNRLEGLKGKVVIPQELFDGMQELRLLGNDAAHVESETFNDIGKEEIEISIDFTKEILKSVYQYVDLLSKLKSLKKKTE